MEQGIQSKIEDAEVKESGCYALCLLRWAEVEKGADYNAREALEIIEEARKLGYIGAECYVKQPAEVFNLACGNREKIKAVKVDRDWFEIDDKGNRTGRMYDPQKHYIICQKKPMYTHFIFYDGGQAWDPLPPNRPSNHGYQPASYRILI
jgi:hypothetical protein